MHHQRAMHSVRCTACKQCAMPPGAARRALPSLHMAWQCAYLCDRGAEVAVRRHEPCHKGGRALADEGNHTKHGATRGLAEEGKHQQRAHLAGGRGGSGRRSVRRPALARVGALTSGRRAATRRCADGCNCMRLQLAAHRGGEAVVAQAHQQAEGALGHEQRLQHPQPAAHAAQPARHVAREAASEAADQVAQAQAAACAHSRAWRGAQAQRRSLTGRQAGSILRTQCCCSRAAMQPCKKSRPCMRARSRWLSVPLAHPAALPR